ncbi:MAG: type II secretion system protein GspD [Planctomycetaceae bacterium]|nr:type II secretion system protein GspD [Planctomycetales bacterium]MCB9937229.1 type II secretion system protein GspD [Planctomycetaceae bacterium]
MNTRHHAQFSARGQRWWSTTSFRSLHICLLVLALLVQSTASPHVALAVDEDTPMSLEAKLDQKGTIILRDASLVEWLFAIQREWGIDIVVGNELQREVVNGAFTDTTLREVLNSILISRGYGYRQVGKSLLIVRLDDLTIKPDQKTVLIPLDLLNPQEVESSIQLLLSQQGQVQSIPSSRSLFLIDTPEVIDRVRKFLDELEANARRMQDRERERLNPPELQVPAQSDPSQPPLGSGPAFGVDVVEVEEHIEVFAPQYVTATAFAEILQSIVLDARVTPIVEENKVIVASTPQGIETAKRVLARVDMPRKQVRITAYMYDVNVEIMERLGFNWSNVGKGRINGSGDPQSLFDFESNSFQGATPAATTTTTDPTTGAAAAASTAASSSLGGLITLSHLSRHFDLTAVIQALEQTDGARLLARPNIMAYDRTEATFQSVQEIPVQQLTQTSQGGNIGTTEFREAGITLTVTPFINADNSVRLIVTPAFSVLNGFNNGQPIIDRRSASTTLTLRDGEPSVIGGLVRRNEIESKMGVPGIMHWKYIGLFFRNHNTTITESELVVFIRAEVVDIGFQGDLRDLATHSTTNSLLEQIPYATPAPVVDTCCDPYCPYHNPRPRYTGDFGGVTPVHGYEYYHPTTGQPQEALPSPAEPAMESAPSQAPTISVPEQPTFNDTDIQLPPPVVIDEMARRYQQLRSNVARLPDVRQVSPRQAERPPIVVRPYRQASTVPNTNGYRTANSNNRTPPITTSQPPRR